MVFYVIAGVVFAVTLIPVIRLLTAAQAGLHSALLSQRTGLDRQVEAQVTARSPRPDPRGGDCPAPTRA